MQEAIPTSLLKLSSDNVSRALKLFQCITRYMEGPDSQVQAVQTELAQKVLHQVWIKFVPSHQLSDSCSLLYGRHSYPWLALHHT